MRIDGTSYGSGCLAGGANAAAGKSNRSGKPLQGAANRPVLSAGEKELVTRALAAEQVNATAVAEARRLLESGQLDTPEAIDRAAAVLLDLGV